MEQVNKDNERTTGIKKKEILINIERKMNENGLTKKEIVEDENNNETFIEENSNKAEDELDVNIFSPFKKDEKKEKAKEKNGKPVSIGTYSEYYDMTNENRGIALIFNHMNFTNMNKRSGTNKDRDNVRDVLESLNFNVRVYNDLTLNDLQVVLYKTSIEDHRNNDCFVIVVMSHGDDGVIYAKDAKYPVKLLWMPFTGDKCKSLIGKPKMCFIQACRGDQLDAGATFKPGMDVVDSEIIEESITYNIPQMADLLVMYSTFEGHYSWRNPAEGSWFIQGLCKEFIENGKIRDLLTLLTGVCRRVAYEYQSNVPGDKIMDCMKQMPCIVSMLTKTLYFTKKDYIGK